MRTRYDGDDTEAERLSALSVVAAVYALCLTLVDSICIVNKDEYRMSLRTG